MRYKNDKSVESAINELYQKAIECHNYQVGDLITVSGEQYYVIVDSLKTQDYVIALKEKPLTVSEVNIYGSSIPVSATNQSGYGGMAFGTVNNYDSFNVKIVVDNWATAKFTNNQLKNIDNYTARLIKVDELVDLGFVRSGALYPINENVPAWVYKVNYWTMTPSDYGGNRIRVVTNTSRGVDYYPPDFKFSVRPVINVYKSAITKLN